MKSFRDFDLPGRVFEPVFEIAGVNRVLAEKLVTRGFGVPNFVFLAELNRPRGPTIGFVVKPVVLIGAGHVRVSLRDDRRGERADVVVLDSRCHEFGSAQQDLDRLLVTAGEMMKTRLCGQGVRGLNGIGGGIEHGQRLAQTLKTALVAGGDEGSRDLALQPHARCLIAGEIECSLKMFAGEDRFAVEHVNLADRFILF